MLSSSFFLPKYLSLSLLMAASWELTAVSGGRVIFGNGTSSHLKEYIEKYLPMDASSPRRCAVICSPSDRAKADASRVAAALVGYDVHIVPEASLHVPQSTVDHCLSVIRGFDPKFLVSVGGGSCVGLAKAIAASTRLPIVAIPTNYSGSEMTNIYGITTAEGKVTKRDDWVRAAVVVYDVSLTLSLPLLQTAKSAFNAMAHAVDAMWTATPPVALMAEEGLRVLSAALSAFDPHRLDDVTVRSQLLYGAFLCGSVLHAAPMALHHKIAHVLGGSFHLDHTDAHTVLLPHTMAFNISSPHTERSTKRIDDALGSRGDPAAFLFDLQRKLNVPQSLRTVGLKYSDIPSVASECLRSPYPNPRPIDQKSIEYLLEDAYHSRKPRQQTVKISFAELSADLAKSLQGEHSLPRVSMRGAQLHSAEVIIICLHGRSSNAVCSLSITQYLPLSFSLSLSLSSLSPSPFSHIFAHSLFLSLSLSLSLSLFFPFF
jgi:maleylacetate reductase